MVTPNLDDWILLECVDCDTSHADIYARLGHPIKLKIEEQCFSSRHHWMAHGGIDVFICCDRKQKQLPLGTWVRMATLLHAERLTDELCAQFTLDDMMIESKLRSS